MTLAFDDTACSGKNHSPAVRVSSGLTLPRYDRHTVPSLTVRFTGKPAAPCRSRGWLRHDDRFFLSPQSKKKTVCLFCIRSMAENVSLRRTRRPENLYSPLRRARRMAGPPRFRRLCYSVPNSYCSSLSRMADITIAMTPDTMAAVAAGTSDTSLSMRRRKNTDGHSCVFVRTMGSA